MANSIFEAFLKIWFSFPFFNTRQTHSSRRCRLTVGCSRRQLAQGYLLFCIKLAQSTADSGFLRCLHFNREVWQQFPQIIKDTDAVTTTPDLRSHRENPNAGFLVALRAVMSSENLRVEFHGRLGFLKTTNPADLLNHPDNCQCPGAIASGLSTNIPKNPLTTRTVPPLIHSIAPLSHLS